MVIPRPVLQWSAVLAEDPNGAAGACRYQFGTCRLRKLLQAAFEFNRHCMDGGVGSLLGLKIKFSSSREVGPLDV